MGSRGPIPKRSTERIGHATKAKDKAERKVVSDTVVEPGKVNPKWHPIARQMFESLKQPETVQFMLISDWAAARDAAQTLTLAYKTLSAEIFKIADRKWERLLLTESSRRRAGIEVERRNPEQEGVAPESVVDHRSRLSVVS